MIHLKLSDDDMPLLKTLQHRPPPPISLQEKCKVQLMDPIFFLPLFLKHTATLIPLHWLPLQPRIIFLQLPSQLSHSCTPSLYSNVTLSISTFQNLHLPLQLRSTLLLFGCPACLISLHTRINISSMNKGILSEKRKGLKQGEERNIFAKTNNQL